MVWVDNMAMGNFSVLCSIYIKEKPEYLEQCFQSIEWQTLESNEVVVVHDGPLTNELYAVLENWKSKLPIIEVVLKENVGLGEALNQGLKHCTNDLVVRVDTDDINHIVRFEKQVKYMLDNPDIHAVSSSILEFDTDPDNPNYLKEVPCDDEIKAYSLKRNPLNHAASIFRKEAVLASGGYQHLLYMEDYYLWLRLQANGYKINNLSEPLVSVRVGNGMLEKRKGLNYAKSEIILMKEMYALKLARKPTTAMFFLARSASRLMPAFILKHIYKLYLR